MNTQPILAYDCATTGASVALRTGGHTHTRTIGQTQQAAELVPAINALLHEHHVKYHELAAIVTTTGPGSFTGVRIGLAALHGFALVAKTPVKLLTTLEACAWQIAASAAAPQDFIVTLRAGKGEVYAQRFATQNRHITATNDITLAPETKTDWPVPHFADITPDAAHMATIVEYLPPATLADAVPLYIRPPDAIAAAPPAWLAAN